MKKINLLNKTISHLSSGYGFSPFHGKGVRRNRRGVWGFPFAGKRGPAEQPGGMEITPSPFGATPSWKEGERSGRCGLWFAALVALFVATPSFAEPTELDKKTVASKAYVDTKQDIIETSMVETWGYTLPSLVTYDSTDGGLTGTKFGVLRLSDLDSDGSNLKDCTDTPDCEEMLPTANAVADALHDLWENMPSGWTALSWNVNNDNGATQTAAINAYNTTFGSGTNNWAGNATDLIDGQFLANSLALKQNKITTGNVMFHDDPDGTQGDMYVPGLVAYDSQTNALSGNKIGILDQETIYDDEGNLNNYDIYGAEMDNFVPTVRAVAQGLAVKQNILPAAWTSTTSYNTMASTGGLTIELGAFDGAVEHRYITAGGSQPLTKKSGADNVISYVNGTTSLAGFRSSNFGGNISATTSKYIKGALVSLELLKDVYSALHNEIQNATPTGTPGNVAMYDASTGALGDGVATYDGSTTYNASTDAAKIAVMSGVQRKKECGGYEPAPAGEPAHDGTHPGDEDYCWLWIFPD